MINSILRGFSGFFLLAFVLVMLLIRPLWIDIDKFLTKAFRIPMQWVTMVEALTAVMSAVILTGFFQEIISSENKGVPIFPLLAFMIWAGAGGFLLAQLRYTIFSIVSPKKLFMAIASCCTGFIGLMVLVLKAAGRDLSGSALVVGSGVFILAALFSGASALALIRERLRWPGVSCRLHPQWSAKWITLPKASAIFKLFFCFKTPPNRWICFRRKVIIEDAPAAAEAKIAVDTKYWLWINGRMVVSEGGLKRGPNPYDTYHDEIDIAPFLDKGENTIAVLLWHFGRDSFSHKNSGRAGLIFDCRADGLEIVSDSRWKACRHPSYGSAGNPEPNFRLAEANILYDARKELPGWNEPGFDDSKWEYASESGSPPAAPWNNLVRRQIPMWKDYGMSSYKNQPLMPFISSGEPIVCDLPYNAQIQPAFTISSDAGLLADIRTDDYMGGGEYGIRSCYITRQGLQAYEVPAWMNGHKVIYAFPEGIEVLSLAYRETGYDTEFTGTFSCDDDFYNVLWQKAQRTLYISMRDNYMDCPDRERAQWWWDTALEIGESFYALDTKSHLLAKKAMLELTSWQRSDGSLYSPVPSGNWDIELPMQMLSSIGWYGFHTYYINTADDETIRKCYPALKQYLELWKLNEKGIASIRKCGWNWGDWGSEIDIELLGNCWYYLAVKGLEHLAYVAERPDDAVTFVEKMNLMEKGFNDYFWNGDSYRSPSYKGKTDDRGNALAVCAGLAKRSCYPAIKRVLEEEFHSSPALEKHVLEALFVMGYHTEALERMKRRFMPMVQAEYSTLWEGWEIGSLEYGGGTINHAWSGGSLTLLSMYAAGVRPVKPGYKEYEIMPRMGSLNRIVCKLSTIKGEIGVELEKNENCFKLKLDSPSETTALIGIPDEYKGDIRLSDAIENEYSMQDSHAKGVTYLGMDGGFRKFKLYHKGTVLLTCKRQDRNIL